MSSSAELAPEREPRILRGIAVTDASMLSAQLEACGPDDPNSVDPRLRDRSIEVGQRLGFDRGYQDGLEAAQSQIQQQIGDLRNAILALQEAATDFRQAEIDQLQVNEEQILDGIFAIARAVLQHEVTLESESGRAAIKRALALAPNGNSATVFLNPSDADAFESPEIEAEGRTIRVVADENVQRGGCILEIGPTRIDAQLETALERMREVL